MRMAELIRFTARSAVSHRLRSVLTALGIAIGVAAVLLLTSIGEGLHNYMLTQFTQFGTNIIGINPGKAKTFGMPTGVLNTVRPLNLDDAAALNRVPHVRSTLPLVQGTASVESGGRERKPMPCSAASCAASCSGSATRWVSGSVSVGSAIPWSE
jgi:putative ABC transport system permease protein